MPKISFKVRPTPFCALYQTDKDHDMVGICENVIKKVTGEAHLFYRNSVADECIFANRLHVPVVTIGPSGSGAHQAGEYVEISSVKRVSKIYLTALQDIDRVSA